MGFSELIAEYEAGPDLLKAAIAGMTDEELNAVPIPGQWSTRQVICHLADFEPVYADRMKHVIAEDQPEFRGGFHDAFAAHLAYESRAIDEELALIEAVRKQMGRILTALPDTVFSRTGVHSVDGPLTLETLLERITNHIPHHARFIADKRQALSD